jgi:WD40 repeat protein
MRHPGSIAYSIGTAFSPDGSTVATACEDGSVRVWDVATSRPIGPGLRHRGRVLMVAFASDTEIRTGTPTGTVRFWNAERSPVRGHVERVQLWIQVITGFELDDDGELRALDGRLWKERRARLHELGGPPPGA